MQKVKKFTDVISVLKFIDELAKTKCKGLLNCSPNKDKTWGWQVTWNQK